MTMLDWEMDAVMAYIDDFLCKGDFDIVDQICLATCKSTNKDLLLTLLTITFMAKDKLPSRNQLFCWADFMFADEQDILKGLY